MTTPSAGVPTRRRAALAATLAATLTATVLLPGCAGGSHPGPRPVEPRCRLASAHVSSPLRPLPASASGLHLGGTFRVRVKSGFGVPPGAVLFPAGDDGAVYVQSGDVVGRADRTGRLVWAMTGSHVGVRLIPTAHDVVAVTGLGDVAVLDGPTGRMLACTSGAGEANAPVVDGDLVGVVRPGGSVTTIDRFDAGSGGGFTPFGHVPGRWALLGQGAGFAVLGGHFAGRGHDAVTRLAWADTPEPAGALTPGPRDGGAHATMSPYPGPALPDTSDYYLPYDAGSNAAGLEFRGPLGSPQPAADLFWAGARVIDPGGALTIVQDEYADVTHGGGWSGGIAALDHDGRIRWRTAGIGKVTNAGGRAVFTTSAGGRIVLATTTKDKVRFLVLAKTDGHRVAAVAVAGSGLRTLTGAREPAWAWIDDGAVAVAPSGRYATVGVGGPARTVTALTAGPASSQAVLQVAAANGTGTPQSYVVGP